jgi:hypothetical protein
MRLGFHREAGAAWMNRWAFLETLGAQEPNFHPEARTCPAQHEFWGPGQPEPQWRQKGMSGSGTHDWTGGPGVIPFEGVNDP